MNRHYIPSNYMRAWREDRGLSLSQMAVRTGIHKSTMSRMESGKTPYHRDILEGYARVLDCHPADLISRRPGVAEDLFRILHQCGADELLSLEVVAKELFEQRRKKKLADASE